jgi:hypothetical protein
MLFAKKRRPRIAFEAKMGPLAAIPFENMLLLSAAAAVYIQGFDMKSRADVR